MVAGVNLFSGGNTQPNRTDPKDEPSGSDETTTETNSGSGADDGGTTPAEETGSSNVKPVTETPSTGDADATGGAVGSEPDPIVVSAAPQGDGQIAAALEDQLRAAAEAARSEIAREMRIDAIEDAAEGATSAVPAALIEDAYVEGQEASSPPETDATMDILG